MRLTSKVRVPVLLGVVQEGCPAGDAGVVDHDVDSAEQVDGPMDRRRAYVLAAQVARVAVNLAEFAQLADRLPESILQYVADEDLGPLLEEPGGDGPAYAPCAAGHDGGLTYKFSHVAYLARVATGG